MTEREREELEDDWIGRRLAAPIVLGERGETGTDNYRAIESSLDAFEKRVRRRRNCAECGGRGCDACQSEPPKLPERCPGSGAIEESAPGMFTGYGTVAEHLPC